MTKIAFWGECMIEQSAVEVLRYGGDTLNSALYLARVSANDNHNTAKQIQVYFATSIGTDKNSERLLTCWKEEGINTQLVTRIQGKTVGSYHIQTNESGERRFDYDRDDSAAKYYFQTNETPFAELLIAHEIDYVYFSGISLAIISQQECEQLFEQLTRFKARGGGVIFDNNYREVLWRPRSTADRQYCYQQAMALADFAFLTDEDEFALYGDNNVSATLQRYQENDELGATELIIKQGKKPCIVLPKIVRPKTVKQKEAELSRAISDSEKPISINSQPIEPEKIIDTTAAGDAFAAGYLAKRLSGHNIICSATFAHVIAGRVIQYPGAIVPKHALFDLMPSNISS